MHKFVPVVMLIAISSIFCWPPVAAERALTTLHDRTSATDNSNYGGAILLVGGMGGGGTNGGMGGMTGGMGGMTGGGMGGMTGGGMGGMTGGGMGGMTGGMGGMTGGNMTGMTGGMGGMTGGDVGSATGYSNAPGGGANPYGRSETAADGPQRPQPYHCVTQHGQCSVSSALGPLRSGASCTCLFGGKGKIK
jgi:hypothetical protein